MMFIECLAIFQNEDFHVSLNDHPRVNEFTPIYYLPKRDCELTSVTNILCFITIHAQWPSNKLNICTRP